MDSPVVPLCMRIVLSREGVLDVKVVVSTTVNIIVDGALTER